MKKPIFYTEVAYICGILLITLGVAFMGKADFGYSMVVAPAYLLHRWLAPMFPWFTFGTAEYTLQSVLILLTFLLLRRFRVGYLFSFVTAVIYGLVLDGVCLLTDGLPAELFSLRVLWYILGTLLVSAGVSMMFHSYISPQAYELFVKEVSERYHINIHKFKTGYDCVSCLLGVVMSFLIFGFGHFEGVKLGTAINALVNGFLISRFSALYENSWKFRDALPWRRFFTGESK